MIAGFFNPNYERPVPMVRVAVVLPGVTDARRDVEFVVDTGASVTVIHPAAATGMLGIETDALAGQERWPTHRVHRGIGGIATFYVQPAEYGFPSAEKPKATTMAL